MADAALAVALLALNGSILRSLGVADVAAWLLSAAHVAPVITRRRWPVPSLVTGALAGALYVLAGWPMVGLGLAALVLVYSAAAYGTRGASLVAVAATGGALAVIDAVRGGGPDASTMAGNLAILAAAWVFGDATRRRHLLADLYRERLLELEAAEAELARRAVVTERMRIARELHDIVAHSMSAIAVHAGASRVAAAGGGDDGADARRSLATIEKLSRDAMDEMRRLLGVLRASPDDGVPLMPMPALRDLDALVAESATLGTAVDLEVRGERRDLSPGVELAAYRIVQEALTNARRHAPGESASVCLSFEGAALAITVDNRIPRGGRRARSGGLGLAGMRERAEIYGGHLDAGVVDEGTFRVSARLPYEGTAP